MKTIRTYNYELLNFDSDPLIVSSRDESTVDPNASPPANNLPAPTTPKAVSIAKRSSTLILKHLKESFARLWTAVWQALNSRPPVPPYRRRSGDRANTDAQAATLTTPPTPPSGH